MKTKLQKQRLEILNMHLKTFEYQGLIFGGFEGCVRYKNDPYAKMYTQEEASELLLDKQVMKKEKDRIK